MKRCHVFLPEVLLRKIEAAARKRGITLSEEIRYWLYAEAQRREGKK